MTNERIFLITIGALLVVSRSVGVVAPKTFGYLVQRFFQSKNFRIWGRLLGLLLACTGALGIYISLEVDTIQGITVNVISAIFILTGLVLLLGKHDLGTLFSIISSNITVLRVLCLIGVLIGLLLVHLGYSSK